MKTISVAMAVYNGEKYLPEQLDSILTQLKPGDEIVVSYDKSKDVPQQDGSVMHLSQERHMLWQDVQSVKYKPGKAVIQLYHTPHCAPLVLRLPPEEYDLAAAYVGKYCKGK